MYFIHIVTLSDAKDFTSWLNGKNKLAFNDSTEFDNWLEGQEVFPLEIYIDGVTIRFDTKIDLEFFRLGWETALQLRIKKWN